MNLYRVNIVFPDLDLGREAAYMVKARNKTEAIFTCGAMSGRSQIQAVDIQVTLMRRGV